MKKLQFESLVISDLEGESFGHPSHSHTYYEMVYVLKGNGNHHINNIILPYKCGDLFLISPDDQHYFEYNKYSRLIFIKFTDDYFKGNKHLSPDSFAMNSPENVMRKQVLKEKKLIFSEPCKTILKKTIENILSYNCRKDVSTSPIVFYQILSIFGLIKEATSKMDIRLDVGLQNKEDVISYIHQNIYQPETIRIKNIAYHFNISPTYFSAYFKRNFEVSYRDYINDYGMALIERRMESGQNTIKQIAYEFGFTDESHLSHYFKNKKSKTLGSYKNKSRSLA